MSNEMVDRQSYFEWWDDRAEDQLLREEEPEHNVPEAVMDRLPEPEEDHGDRP